MSRLVLPVAFLFIASACRVEEAIHKPDPDLNRMLEVPRYDAYESSTFFADGATLRVPPEGSVPYVRTLGELPGGQNADGWFKTFPLKLDRPLLETGQSRFSRICAACHGVAGDGNTVVAKHMPRPPPSLHERRIRDLPVGKIFFVIESGYGMMPGYAAVLEPRERWAVVAYLRALQRSRHAPVAELPKPIADELRGRLR